MMEPMKSPATFNDMRDHSWVLELDFHKLRAIKKSVNIDLGSLTEIGRTWAEILSDDDKALSVIWLALADRAEGISQEEWLTVMDGERLEAARDALLVALENFTPPGRRAMLSAAAGKIHEKYHEAIGEATKLIEELTDETATRALAALGTPPSSAPESSAILTTAGP